MASPVTRIQKRTRQTNREKHYENGIWVATTSRWKDICPNGKLYFFTKEQADEMGVKYFPVSEWHKAKRGEWIETHDGYVIMVLNRNDNPGFPYLSTYFATYVLTKSGIKRHNKNKEVNTIRRERRTTISSSGIIPKNKHLTEKQLTFVAMVAANILAYGRPEYQKCANIAFGREVRRVEWERLVLSEKFQRGLVMNLKDAMMNAGIDESWGYRQLKQMVEDPEVDSELKFKIIQEIQFHQGVVLSKQVTGIVGSVNPNTRSLGASSIMENEDMKAIRNYQEEPKELEFKNN